MAMSTRETRVGEPASPQMQQTKKIRDDSSSSDSLSGNQDKSYANGGKDIHISDCPNVEMQKTSERDGVISATSDDGSVTLLDLPEELLLEIGKFVMADLPITTISFAALKESVPSMFRDSSRLRRPPAPPAILTVCSALRRILRSYYFKDKLKLQLKVRYVTGGRVQEEYMLDRYMEIIGPQARAQLSGTFQRHKIDLEDNSPWVTSLSSENFKVVFGDAIPQRPQKIALIRAVLIATSTGGWCGRSRWNEAFSLAGGALANDVVHILGRGPDGQAGQNLRKGLRQRIGVIAPHASTA